LKLATSTCIDSTARTASTGSWNAAITASPTVLTMKP
jgi:hypothetical protein